MYIEEKAYNARDYVKEISQSQIENCGTIIELTLHPLVATFVSAF